MIFVSLPHFCKVQEAVKKRYVFQVYPPAENFEKNMAPNLHSFLNVVAQDAAIAIIFQTWVIQVYCQRDGEDERWIFKHRKEMVS